MQPPPETLTAPLVLLRRANPADAQCLYQAARNADVMRFMDWPMPTDPGDTESHLRKCSADWDSGSEYQWVILDRDSVQCVGTISCRPEGHSADFGYFLGRDHWGRGFATDAASAVVAWLEAQPEIIRIWASVDVENVRSRRLLERLGLQLEGVLRMATIRPNIGGPPRDTAVYARTKSSMR
jgi:RimJ/RimL family protein N-acetyltransferase